MKKGRPGVVLAALARPATSAPSPRRCCARRRRSACGSARSAAGSSSAASSPSRWPASRSASSSACSTARPSTPRPSTMTAARSRDDGPAGQGCVGRGARRRRGADVVSDLLDAPRDPYRGSFTRCSSRSPAASTPLWSRPSPRGRSVSARSPSPRSPRARRGRARGRPRGRAGDRDRARDARDRRARERGLPSQRPLALLSLQERALRAPRRARGTGAPCFPEPTPTTPGTGGPDCAPPRRTASSTRCSRPARARRAVRALAAALGVASAEKPASPCLASRIPYGTPVDARDARADRPRGGGA